MNQVDYCIVGGGIAGTTAAETIRALDPKGSITVISAENHPLYSRVMLSKAHYVLGESPRDRVFLRTLANYSKNRIELVLGDPAKEILTESNEILLTSGKKIRYGKLLLATGGTAIKPSYITKSYSNVLPVQNLSDVERIIELLPNVERVIVVGNGFISFEMASIFLKAGKHTTICIRGDRFWRKSLHPDASTILENALTAAGAHIVKEVEITEIHGESNAEAVTLSNGATIAGDMLIYGIGTDYHQYWLDSSPIQQHTGVLITDHLETNIPNIWAAGDCAEYPEVITNEVSMPGNWAHAQMQGKYAGESMVQKKKEPFSHISSYTSGGCGLIPCFVGDTRRSIAETTLLRGTKEEYPKFCELFIKNDAIIGAMLINRGNEIMPIRQLITNRTSVSAYKNELQDGMFDLREIV